MKFCHTVVFLLLCSSLSFCADILPAPDQTPSLTNQEERPLIDQGIALHDQGKFDEAVAKYKEVLAKNPKNILAIYEMTFSQFSAKKYDEALKSGTDGARYKSEYLPQFYMMIGNSLDELGRTDDAITAYRQAEKVLPTDALVQFNFAVTLMNSGKVDEARPHLKSSAMLNPQHPGSQFALGSMYFDQGYKVPSTLALLRFLALEPNSSRSPKALTMIGQNFEANVKEKSPKNIEITIDANAKKDEGDFQMLDLLMSMSHAGKISVGAPQPTPMAMRVNSLDGLFSAMSEQKDNQKGMFVVDYYFPYFIEMKKNSLVLPFVYSIYQSTDEEARQWVEQHPTDVAKFKQWSKDYVWPQTH